MQRRRLLALAGGSAAFALAGCAALVDDGESEDERGFTTVQGAVTGQMATLGAIEASVAAELDLAAALDVDPAYVRVRDGGTAEVLTDGISTAALQTKLSEAGYDVQTTSDGVSEQTREAIVEALQAQLDAAAIDGEVRFEDGSIVAEVTDESAASELTTDPDTVAIELSYPGADEHRRETVLTGADIAEVSGVQDGRAGPEVLVRLTEPAAERFATRLIDTGFTGRGTNACDFDPEGEDAPAGDQYCILTVDDDEVVTAASLDPALAASMESGGFTAEGSFVIRTAGDEQEAQELADVLRAGLPPAKVVFEENEGVEEN